MHVRILLGALLGALLAVTIAQTLEGLHLHPPSVDEFSTQVTKDSLANVPEGQKVCGNIFFTENGTPFVWTWVEQRTNLLPCKTTMWHHGDKWEAVSHWVTDTQSTGYFTIPDDALPVTLHEAVK